MIKTKGNKILILTYISTFVFLLFFASSMGAVLNNSKNVSSKEIINYENNLKKLKTSGYWTLNNISIDDLNSNNWAWAATQPWCSGTGDSGDPYIIENVTIKNSIEGIYIRDSIKYFVVRNVTVYNVTISGIILNNVTNGVLFDNNISSNDIYGIYLTGSKYNLIKENFIFNNTNDGILLGGSTYNHIKENFIHNNTGNGISLIESSNNNTVETNTVINNQNDGISLTDLSHNNTIIGNIVNNNTQSGIFLDSSNNNTIYDNIIKLNDKYGIDLEGSNYNHIKENFIYNNTSHGIELASLSNNNTIETNTITGIGYGIDLATGNGNAIIKNIINGSSYAGIYLYEGNFTKVIGNIVHNNTQSGIDLEIIQNSIIAENTVYNNLQHGINLFAASANNNVTRNIIRDNEDKGINFDVETFDNLIWKNVLLRNGKHAVDAGSNNNWNITTIGNYWDNHTGPDTTPNDGIVDMPYDIGGAAGSVDYLPIAEDGAPRITIYSPSGGNAFSSSAPSFDVTITDDYLDEMWYSIDGGLNNYTFIANGIIEQAAWDAISDGALTLAFYARDIFGNIGSAEVIIEKDTQAPIININSPNPGETFGNAAPSFNVTVTDPNLDSVWLELDGSNFELSIPIIGTINQTAWAALLEGDYIIAFHANDTLGHSSSEAITITKSVPSGGGIGLDYFMTSFLIFITGGLGLIVVIVKIHTKKRIKSS